MTLDEIDEVCRSLQGCEVQYLFESNPHMRSWCIGRKMFAWCATKQTPLAVQLKADPDLVPDLIANYEFIRPGYHMNKRHWITVQAASCPAPMLSQLLEDAHAVLASTLSRRDRLRLLGD